MRDVPLSMSPAIFHRNTMRPSISMEILFLLGQLSTTSASEASMELGAIISAGIFLFVFISIAFQLLHETAAALLGAVAVFLVTYVLGYYFPALQLLTFEDAMEIVDWNVIFLLWGL